MKLFFQLKEEEKNTAVSICIDSIVEAIRSGEFEVQEDEDVEMLVEAIKEFEGMSTTDIVDELMDLDNGSAELLFELGTLKAQETFFHEENESVIFIPSLNEDEKESQQKIPNNKLN